MPVAALPAHSSSRSCDEAQSSHKRKLLLHPLLDEQFTMGGSFGEDALLQQIPSFDFVPDKRLEALWVGPPEAPLLEPEALIKEPSRGLSRLGLLCAGLQHWGARRKVHYLGRHQERLSVPGVREERSGRRVEPVRQEIVPVVKTEVQPIKCSSEKRVAKRERKTIVKERKKKKARLEMESTRSACDNLKHRWSKQRYKAAELKLLDVVRQKGAVLGKPILRPELRVEARKYISDTGLLDHLLKHMAGRVDMERGERLRRRHNADGMMEYWLEGADLVELRRQAGVKDPFWVPPPGWKLGDDPYQDSETAKELNQLKKGIANMKSYLEQLLSEKCGSGNGDNGLVLAEKSQYDPEPTCFLEMNHSSQIMNTLKNKLSKERFTWAMQKLLEVVREKSAISGRPIPQSTLMLEARKHILDTSLLHHLLKHMVGKVDKESGDQLCQRCTSDGAVEYWLENVGLVVLPVAVLRPGDNLVSQADWELKQLMEGLSHIKKYLEQLLLTKPMGEEVGTPISSTDGSQSDLESNCSSEVLMQSTRKHSNYSRWSRERYEWAEQKLLDIMNDKGALLGNPILRPDLRTEARKYIGDTGLLDHLLKHMAGKVDKQRGMRFCRRHNADGAMEYWLESADLVEFRKQAGVKDPYWIPPPGWKPGDNPYHDSETMREFNELKEELSSMSRYLEQLLSQKLSFGDGAKTLNLSKPPLAGAISVTLTEISTDQHSTSKNVWSKERYDWAEQKLLDIIREEGAVLEKPMPSPELKSVARKHIPELSLVDHLLKHIAGRVDHRSGKILCKRLNSEGFLEFWFDSADMVESQKSVGVEGHKNSDLEKSTELKQLKEEIGSMHRYLEYLLSKRHDSGTEDGGDDKNLTKCSPSDPEPTSSLEDLSVRKSVDVDNGSPDLPDIEQKTGFSEWDLPGIADLLDFL